MTLSRAQHQPAWVEFWEGSQMVRSIPLHEDPSAQRQDVPLSPIPGPGPKVAVLFKHKSTGEDHEQYLTNLLEKTFAFCPISLKRRTPGIFSAAVERDLRHVEMRPPVRLPLLFEGYANDGSGILLRPPFTMSIGAPPVFSEWQNHPLMDVRPPLKEQPKCSLARYFSQDTWEWTEEIPVGDHRDPVTFLTGRGSLAIYCTGGQETDTIVPVCYGAALADLKGKLDLPGFRVVACADNLTTDLSGEKLVENESFSAWLEQIRESIRHFLGLALDRPPQPCQKVSSGVVNLSEAFTLPTLLTLVTVPVAFKLSLLGPGLLLVAGYYFAGYRYTLSFGSSSASSWNAEQIRQFLEQSLQRNSGTADP